MWEAMLNWVIVREPRFSVKRNVSYSYQVNTSMDPDMTSDYPVTKSAVDLFFTFDSL
jgi:hypothetical protein